MNTSIDYYAILGILPTAEMIVIKAAYRALAQKYHPDGHSRPDSNADDRMRKINEAYEILSNPAKRSAYDHARRAASIRDDDLENEFSQSAFNDAEQEQRTHWDLALEYYPDLASIYAGLKMTSIKLAFAFKATILEKKAFAKRRELAALLETEFLQTYFGSNPDIIKLAKELIAGGQKDAAKELNRAIAVLGDEVDIELIRRTLFSKYLKAKPDGRPDSSNRFTKSASELALALKTTHYIEDATLLVEALGGRIEHASRSSSFFFKRDFISVRVLSYSVEFATPYDMVLWVNDVIVPIVLENS